MDQPFHKIITLLAIIILLISGCATTGKSSGSNSSNTDTTKTKAQGTIFGAVIGGALGAATAIATGHQKNIWGYAAAGAVAGGAAGYVAGHKVAQIKQQYTDKEQRLEKETELAAQSNQEIKRKNTETQNQINSLDQEISNIASGNIKTRSQISDLETKKKTAKNMMADNNKTINNMNTELSALEDYRQSLMQTQDSQEVKQLDQEINALQTNIAMLDQSNRQMAKMIETLNVRK